MGPETLEMLEATLKELMEDKPGQRDCFLRDLAWEILDKPRGVPKVGILALGQWILAKVLSHMGCSAVTDLCNYLM